MRIELKDENQEEPQKIDENDIRYKHETDLTKKEKRELEKMKLASMGWKGKLQYIWPIISLRWQPLWRDRHSLFCKRSLRKFQDPYSTYGYGN